MTEDFLIEKHSVADLFKKLEDIHDQTKLTNGRVNKLEKNPMVAFGAKAQANPFKFAVGLTVFVVSGLAVVISDFRHPIIAGLVKLVSWAI